MGAGRALILGCGYTGRLVARGLAAEGWEVIATSRSTDAMQPFPGRLLRMDVGDPDSVRMVAEQVEPGYTILHSVPAAGGRDPSGAMAPLLERAIRIVHISTTGVYGPQVEVNECTAPRAQTAREQVRLEMESSLAIYPEVLILRAAAIYGPHRGMHQSIREGSFRLDPGERYVSRIHVEDLAAHARAGMTTDVTGTWPVADDDPATSRTVAEFCCALLKLPMPPVVAAAELSETRRANRRVDGRAIRAKLGISLLYPSYREGIPAALRAEEAVGQ